MSRSYFHFVSGERLVYDDQGVELESLADAHVHACRLIRRTLRLMSAEQERWTVQIVDENGDLLLTVLFPHGDSVRTRATKPTCDTPAGLRGFASAVRTDGQGAGSPVVVLEAGRASRGAAF